MLSLTRKLILRVSRREICDAERLCVYAPTELEQLRSDGDGFLRLLYVHRMGSMTPEMAVVRVAAWVAPGKAAVRAALRVAVEGAAVRSGEVAAVVVVALAAAQAAPAVVTRRRRPRRRWRACSRNAKEVTRRRRRVTATVSSNDEITATGS